MEIPPFCLQTPDMSTPFELFKEFVSKRDAIWEKSHEISDECRSRSRKESNSYYAEKKRLEDEYYERKRLLKKTRDEVLSNLHKKDEENREAAKNAVSDLEDEFGFGRNKELAKLKFFDEFHTWSYIKFQKVEYMGNDTFMLHSKDFENLVKYVDVNKKRLSTEYEKLFMEKITDSYDLDDLLHVHTQQFPTKNSQITFRAKVPTRREDIGDFFRNLKTWKDNFFSVDLRSTVEVQEDNKIHMKLDVNDAWYDE